MNRDHPPIAAAQLPTGQRAVATRNGRRPGELQDYDEALAGAAGAGNHHEETKMFRLPKPDEAFPTLVKINCPDGESTEEREITVHFRVIPSSEFDKLSASRKGAAPLLERLIADWDGVHGPDGKPLPCTPENVRLAAEIPYFAFGVQHAYLERFTPLKNLRALRAISGMGL